jgi:hypothetical protein
MSERDDVLTLENQRLKTEKLIAAYAGGPSPDVPDINEMVVLILENQAAIMDTLSKVRRLQ